MLKSTVTSAFSFLLAIILGLGVFTVFAPSTQAFDGPNSLLFDNDGIENRYVYFTFEMYFEDVDRDTLFEFMKEIQNDDLWCLCSTTEVVREGFGQRQIGRQWFQVYDFGGVQDQLTYTRLFLQEDRNHTWIADGIAGDTFGSYNYSDLDNGGTLLTFVGLQKFEFPIDEATSLTFFEDLGNFYEAAFIPYFDSEGTVDLTQYYTFVR